MSGSSQNIAGDAIATLTVNPAVDVSTSVQRIMPFHKLRCDEAQRDPGGGGINVARVLRRFGTNAGAIYLAGGATGQLLQQLVERERVSGHVVTIRGETREDFTVIDRSTGEQFRFVLPGPPVAQEEFERLFETLRDSVVGLDFLLASGSLPVAAPRDLFAGVARIAASNRVKMVLDTSGPGLAEALSQPIYLMKPNRREFQELVCRPLETSAQCLSAARQIIQTRGVSMIALTLAEQGAMLVTRENAWLGLAPRIKPVSTVGAGDSFLGALTWRLALGRNLDDALRYAIAAGSAALLSPGTELCRLDDVERLLPQVTLSEAWE